MQKGLIRLKAISTLPSLLIILVETLLKIPCYSWNWGGKLNMRILSGTTYVILSSAFLREEHINIIRHCEERSDVAISTGSSLFFSLRNQFTDTISQVPTQNKKMKSSLVHISFIFLPLTPSLFEGVRISSFHLFHNPKSPEFKNQDLKLWLLVGEDARIVSRRNNFIIS